MAEMTWYILTTHQLETLVQKNKNYPNGLQLCCVPKTQQLLVHLFYSKFTKVHAGIRFSVSSSSEQKCCSLYMCPSMAAGFEASTLAK